MYQQGVKPTAILEEIRSREYFEESVIPSMGVLYQYLQNNGLVGIRKKDQKELDDARVELNKLKQKLKKKRFTVARDKIVKAFKDGDLSVDDKAYEKIAEMQLLITELVNNSRKREDGEINVDKLHKSVKILDTFVNTLLKARILEGKATDKIDIETKETLFDKMREDYIPETIDKIEEALKGTEDSE